MSLPGLALLGAALLAWIWAWRALAADARGGYDVSMGGAGLYSGYWLLGALAGAAGLVLIARVGAGWGLVLAPLLYAPRNLVYRYIVARNLGREAPPLPRNGFKEYLRRSGQGQDRDRG